MIKKAACHVEYSKLPMLIKLELPFRLKDFPELLP